MRRAGRRSLLPLLAMVCVCLPAQADDDKNPQKTLDALDSSIGKIRQELKKDQASQAELSRRLKQVEKQAASIGAGLRTLQQNIEEQNRRLDRYRDERAKLAERLGRHHEELNRQARASYYTGRQEFFKLLFNQEQPAKVGRVLGYYRYYHQARLNAMASVQEDIGRLEILEEQITTELQRLETLQARRRQEHAALLNTRRERSALLSELDSRIRNKDAHLDKMLSEKQQLEKLIRELASRRDDRFADGPAFAGRKGKLGWPTAGRLKTRFGQTRLGGMKWQGIVIAADEGNEVAAVARGRVAFADWLPGYGMVLILDHGEDFLSLYGYNQALLKRKGDWVEAGEAVATVGNSGGQDASGLYFEIRHKGQARDPRIWLGNSSQLAGRR